MRKKARALIVFVMVGAFISLLNLNQCSKCGSNRKATMDDMRNISVAIESYIIEKEKAPEVQSFAELKDLLEPSFIKILPLKDAWGNDFHYTHGTGAKKTEYAIGSGGKDGVFKGWNQSGFYMETTPADYDKDIILANSHFTYAPEIK